jgi:nitric oxide reductase NorD protein
VHDERLLIEDARKAVGELDQQGIFTYCISLDRQADATSATSSASAIR